LTNSNDSATTTFDEIFAYDGNGDILALVMRGAHTGKQSWNKQWENFFEDNPRATSKDILRHLEEMKKNFGIK
jgi:hypothetical protein